MSKIDISKVGERISNLRKEQRLTLKEMSEYTGLSIGFLSNLETGKTSPTLENLKMVTSALQTDIISLLTVEDHQKLFIPLDETTEVKYPNNNIQVKSIDFGFNTYINQIITIEPGAKKTASFYKHLHDESCTVIEGELVVEIDEDIYILKKYDSIYIPAKYRHKIYNKSDKKCVAYWTYLKI